MSHTVVVGGHMNLSSNGSWHQIQSVIRERNGSANVNQHDPVSRLFFSKIANIQNEDSKSTLNRRRSAAIDLNRVRQEITSFMTENMQFMEMSDLRLHLAKDKAKDKDTKEDKKDTKESDSKERESSWLEKFHEHYKDDPAYYHSMESLKSLALSSGLAAAGDLSGAVENGVDAIVQMGISIYENFMRDFRRNGNGGTNANNGNPDGGTIEGTVTRTERD